LHREVNVERRTENKEYNNEGKNRARPHENEDTKENEERMPQCKGDNFRYLDRLINTLEEGHLCLLDTKRKSLCMRVNKIEGNS
jgi:hypothetical protein